MSAPTEIEVQRKVRQWLDYAEQDLRLARHALTLSTAVPYRLVAYHAQQCAEKSLKAFLVFHRIDFPYTHNISRLLELCRGVEPWSDTLLDAEELSVYAVTTRYPGEDEEVTEEDTLRAIDLAAVVRDVVAEALSGLC